MPTPDEARTADLANQIARELDLTAAQVAATIRLFDEDNTIPFIARYRKEVTGGLDEVQLDRIQERLSYLRALAERKADVLRLIGEQGKLTPEVAAAIERATTQQAVEDIYLPFRPKRRTRATIARERGLAPLADVILAQARPKGGREPSAQPFVSAEKEVASVDEALAGARDVVAEVIAENPELRGELREAFAREATVSCGKADPAKDPQGKYRLYYEFTGPVGRLLPHQVLAINRAEKEGVLKAGLDLPEERAQGAIHRRFPVNPASPFADDLRAAAADSYKRLLGPSLERESRAGLTESAEAHAIEVFAANLRPLLLQPPLKGQKVMGIDPGFRTGCKVAVVDETGRYLEGATIYPHEPQRRWADAKRLILDLIRRHGVSAIAIGNGTASRETESLVAEVIAETRDDLPNLAYAMVSEAGASVYSASAIAREEFPDLEASQRGNISIARRLQDPLAELVKIDPKAIGVGLYQHDVDQKKLGQALERVVERCVNFAGVDANTASAPLLQRVSGINKRVAEAIVRQRDKHGRFRERAALRKVPGLGEATFVQAAGFIRVRDGDNPLDDTFIHPESYDACRRLLDLMPPAQPGEKLSERVRRFRAGLKRERDLSELAAKVGVGVPTLTDILANLERPGLDPRDELPRPILRRDVLKMEDLKPGMVLLGTVRNVVDFGAFVDIGVKQDGLVHISEMAERRVRSPFEVVSPGDVVSVRVVGVDKERGRIQLSLRQTKAEEAAG